jgi:tyrosyl-tRNA synthetase
MAVAAGNYKLADLLTETGLAASKAEAKRLIEQGGVKINGEKASPSLVDVQIGPDELILQIGKRKFLRIPSSND